ncbi:hypothetical protein M9Y10_034110 [Tritrichomonas musculus]|uniref:Uncharacterized protein n=1 Tax=Tritrichomonas musculus TaxID=1915356 RepID=A0ABR2GP52_9EUKA
MNQEIQEYFESKGELYDLTLSFLDNKDDTEVGFQNISEFLSSHQIPENRIELREFLHLIVSISSNHHRQPNFFSKIFQILSFLENQIKQSFSISEMLEIFYKSKRILLYYIEEGIIPKDYSFSAFIVEKFGVKSIHDFFYFLPEVEPFFSKDTTDDFVFGLTILMNKICKNPALIENFEEKRRIGENDSYICSLIRNDAVEEFVSHVNQANIPLTTQIKRSIFETNSFLVDRQPSLIEYAAFFGSIQIFQFLRINKVEINHSIFLYAVHGQNAEIIHLIEEEFTIKRLINYNEIYMEAIKCHHNDIANYVKNNYENRIKPERSAKEIFKYYNYELMAENMDFSIISYFLCKYDYLSLIQILFKTGKINLKDEIEYNKKNKTPLNIAAANNNQDITSFLLSQPEVNSEIINLKDCKKLTELSIPSNVSLIKLLSIENCPLLTKFTILAENFTSAEISIDNCPKLKEFSIHSKIFVICNLFFNDCISFEELKLPSMFHIIGNFSFRGCSALTKIEIPFSLQTISEYSFEGCSSLTEVEIPSSITSIEQFAFSKCTSLKKVTIPSSIKRLEIGIFNECSSLDEIEIPPSVTMIRKYAFSKCTSLKKVTIPSSVKKLGKGVFEGCSSLNEIEIPSSITSIGKYIFSKCTALSKVTFSLPSSIGKIPEFAFQDCSSLTSLAFPPSVTNFESGAFEGCCSLIEIEIPSSMTSIPESLFNGCSSLKSIKIPESVKSIENNAFEKCSSLTEIEIPQNVTYIGKNSFKLCILLTNVTIPRSVETIDRFAFLGCSSLEKVTILNPKTSIRLNAFIRCQSLQQIETSAKSLNCKSIGINKNQNVKIIKPE